MSTIDIDTIAREIAAGLAPEARERAASWLFFYGREWSAEDVPLLARGLVTRSPERFVRSSRPNEGLQQLDYAWRTDVGLAVARVLAEVNRG